MPGCPSGQREQTVNLPADAYGGSNPSPGTGPRASDNLAPLAQSVERFHGKEEVFGSNPEGGSIAAEPLGRGGVAQLVRALDS